MNLRRNMLFQTVKPLDCGDLTRGLREAWGLPCGRLAAIFVALFLCSCTTLDPARAETLGQIAGVAVTAGTLDYLKAHPTAKPHFVGVVKAFQALMNAGITNHFAYVEVLHTLPVDRFESDAGDLYVSSHLVVWDPVTGGSTKIRGAAGMVVVRRIYSGLRLAVAPKPPPR